MSTLLLEIKRNESCTGSRDEKLSCYKDKRNNNIEQIKSAAFKKIVCLLFSISK